jgi:hypothetical protein
MEQIATVKDFSVDTLTKYYSHELEISVASLNAAVAGNLYRIATSDKAGAVTAAIFWLKTRAGWRETSQPEVGRVGEFERMSEEELIEYLRQSAKELGIIESEPPMKLI